MKTYQLAEAEKEIDRLKEVNAGLVEALKKTLDCGKITDGLWGFCLQCKNRMEAALKLANGE